MRENKDLGTLVLLHAPRCGAVSVAFIPPRIGAMDGDKDDFLPAAGDPQWITTSEWDGRRLSRGQVRYVAACSLKTVHARSAWSCKSLGLLF